MIKFKEGDYVTCTINGTYIRNARIHFRSKGRVLAICQNLVKGSRTNNPYGYIYTWSNSYHEGLIQKHQIEFLRRADGNKLTKAIDSAVRDLS